MRFIGAFAVLCITCLSTGCVSGGRQPPVTTNGEITAVSVAQNRAAGQTYWTNLSPSCVPITSDKLLILQFRYSCASGTEEFYIGLAPGSDFVYDSAPTTGPIFKLNKGSMSISGRMPWVV